MTFHDAVNLAFATLRVDSPDTYMRADAEKVLIGDKETITRVLEVEGKVLGVYSYKEGPNGYSLALFALSPVIQRTRIAYSLYKDMKERLNDKPVLFAVYKGNTQMDTLIKKRATKLGTSPTKSGRSISYYSLFFQEQGLWR